MVRPKKSTRDAPTPTPTRRSNRNRSGAVSGTPGERFRSLVSACDDHVPVADVVADSAPVDDDVVVSPPPNKRSKKPTATPFFATVNPALLFARVDEGGSLAGHDDAIPDGDRKLPARSDAIPDGDRKLPARRDATNALLSVIPENTQDDDDLQLFSSSGDSDEAEYEDFREDCVLDPVSGKFHARYSSEEEEYVDAYDDIANGDHDEDMGKDDGDDDNDGGEDDGDDEGGEDDEHKDDNHNVARHAASPFDPSSLFLHAEEDVNSMLSFFADDANYEEEPREPSVNINNE